MIRRRALLGHKPDEPIEFVDAEVKRICVEQWGGTDGGIAAASDRVNNKKVRGKTGEITYKQAASVKKIRKQFQDNAIIEYFDELQYFVNLEYLGVSGSDGGAFRYCSSLKHITIPNGTKYLNPGNQYNEGTFRGCSSLTDIYLPDSIIDCCTALFYGCTSIKTIRWSSNLRIYPSSGTLRQMFRNCYNLETIENMTIPQTINGTTLKSILFCWFEMCSKLDMSCIDFKNIDKIEEKGVKDCYIPPYIILKNCTTIHAYAFGHTYVKGLYFKKDISITPFTFADIDNRCVIDFGGSVSSTNGTVSAGTSTYYTLVFRGDDYSNLTLFSSRESYIEKVFVKSTILDDFKTQHSNISSKVYAIGGAEWTTQFGSSDEWADYPNADPIPVPVGTQIEYLQGDGKAYIDTGIGFTENTITELTIAFASITGKNECVWGAYWDYSPKKPAVQILMSSDGKWIIAGGTGISTVGASNGSTVSLNRVYSIKQTYAAQQYTANAYLFARNNDTGGYIRSVVKIYSAKIWSNNVLVRDFVPVKKDGIGYLYDKVSGELFGNVNSEGAFICGPSIED